MTQPHQVGSGSGHTNAAAYQSLSVRWREEYPSPRCLLAAQSTRVSWKKIQVLVRLAPPTAEAFVDYLKQWPDVFGGQGYTCKECIGIPDPNATNFSMVLAGDLPLDGAPPRAIRHLHAPSPSG